MVTNGPLNFITFPRQLEKVLTYDIVVRSMSESIFYLSINLSGETVHTWAV